MGQHFQILSCIAESAREAMFHRVDKGLKFLNKVEMLRCTHAQTA
jgi:hypothetical protein